MSRNWFPAIMAIGMGVFTGYYTFQPALKELQVEKGQGQRGQLPAPGQQAPSPTNAAQKPATDANQDQK
ncbi:hypothetical protein ANI_1_220024 [Aspergillus terreus]|uniref:Uncharacterized protein n=1 Tax=Aspergillus terreus TaxID=33178 RepID=A0A5M3YPJ2_ASPTE|nr:hypothetical protein ATETN484_0001038200 [Aspergillus terreus]GFF12238.1 hypothetical protein ANI_1_220024 [Aspergillus terreus]